MRPQTIVERLDFVAKRIPGLKFTPPTQLQPGDDQGYDCFMSCDMYYIEIKIDQLQKSVKDVVISHGNNSDGISCPVLRKVLGDQDFETFAKHLSGLHSIYQISTNDKKVKQRAYPALTALEQDLTTLYEHQRRRITNYHDLVHKSPIGIMEPRKGGLPARLTYFITPYDLVDTNQRRLINLNVNNIIDRNLGLSATVEIEGASTHKLQIKSLISTQQNSSLPAYAPFNSQNSEKLPAQFVLKLSQPIPMLTSSICQLVNELNEPSTIKEQLTNLISNSKESLISLIARQELDLNKGPFGRSLDVLKGPDSDSCDLKKHVYSIKLLDQLHTYHILDNFLERNDGAYVSKIPFTHPTSIPTILKILRQQALFNFVIGSCMRRNKSSSNYDENTTKPALEASIFDIMPVDLNSICISFEHPSKESLATLEIDFKELSCQLYALDKESVCSNDFATKVLQKCWSIPVTLRSVLKKCDERRLVLLEDANKRREKELQELLTNNSTTQQGSQYKPRQQYQDNILQTKFTSLHDTSNSRDLNSITEFLSSKINYATTSDASNQTTANTDGASMRSNLLKKYSCKPKTKQSTTTKNQTGNKILSLMLKRQNSAAANVDDANLKATLTKKAKIRILPTEQHQKQINPSASSKMTGLESSVPIINKIPMKQPKQGINSQNISLSLIRSPSKTQSPVTNSNSMLPNSSSTPMIQLQATGSKLIDPPPIAPGTITINNAKGIKSQANGNNLAGKPRKSSINAVLDRLVGGIMPESQSGASNDAISSAESSKGSTLVSKTKVRTPADQFAIKQGTGGSLKLTVTKTKPVTPATSSTPSSNAILNNSSSNSSPALLAASSSSSSATSTTQINNSLAKSSDSTKILGIGAAPSIKYTIPKISKTQQSSSNQVNTSVDSNSNVTDSNQQHDDTSNPSSSINLPNATGSSTVKRTTSTPFNRANNSNRNPVSSSTHPRTTSNPLANASSRPSSTSNNENHLLNRLQSQNNNQQTIRQQQTNNRVSGAQQQSQRINSINPNILANPQQQIHLQQPTQSPMFALGLGQQQSGPFQSTTDLNILAANQVALLNQQRNQNTLISNQQQIPAPFMSSSDDVNLISSTRSQTFIAPGSQQMPILPQGFNLTQTVGDSIQRPTQSILNAAPQFYMRQPMFDDTSDTVSSTPRVANQASQSSFTERKPSLSSNQGPISVNLGSGNPSSGDVGSAIAADPTSSVASSTNPTNSVASNSFRGQAVSSSSDRSNQDVGPATSTPSSPTECNQMETVAPPPLIPIDSLEEPQATSPEADHPDDASDRLSIVDINENLADSLSASGTPKSSDMKSPQSCQDPNSLAPTSSSRPAEVAPVNSSSD